MWNLQWQASCHSGIYEHPPIQLFVSWVGGCLFCFSAMMSAGMMIGANDLSVLIHMKSKSPAIGKDTCRAESRHLIDLRRRYFWLCQEGEIMLNVSCRSFQFFPMFKELERFGKKTAKTVRN